MSTVVLGRFGVGQGAVEAQAMALDESALGPHHGVHVGHQPGAQVGRAFVHVGRVVLEDHDDLRLVRRMAGAQGAVQHVRRHAGVVLVDEAQVGAHEAALADHRIARRGIGAQQVAPHDLLVQGLRSSTGIGSPRAMRSSRPKSEEVNRPVLSAFCRYKRSKLSAITRRMPASRSAAGLCSREEPLP